MESTWSAGWVRRGLQGSGKGPVEPFGGQAGSCMGGQEPAGTDVIAGTAATMPIGRLQRQDLEGSERGGARLGGNHASEASHRPGPHVVVVSTD